MRYRKLGPSGIEASVVGFGAWVTGGGSWWGGTPDDAESGRALNAALDAGVTLIDTAPAYGFGHSEEVVGRVVRGRRDQVVIATKCGLWWKDDRGAPHATVDGRTIRRSVRPDTVRIEVEESLRRLATDRIDLYQIHWPAAPPETTPAAETMACLLDLRRQGKIRAVGVSNVTVDQMKAHRAGGEVTSDQLRYSMLWRAPETDILPYCRENGLATLTYMSLEQGLLTGKVGTDRVFKPGEFRNNETWNPWFKTANRKRVLDLLAGWRDLTEKYRCPLARLVIAWTLAQPGVTHVLCGARRVEQAVENAAGADLELAAEDLDRMRRDIESLGQPA
jgi:methylglyoxal reductase